MNTANPTKRAFRRYLLEFSIAMAAYVATMWLSRAILLRNHEHDTLSSRQLAAALLPVIPVLGLFAAVLRLLLATDELMRRIYINALAIAGGITALLAVSYGLIESPGIPNLSAWWTWTVFMLSFGIATFFVRRHYK